MNLHLGRWRGISICPCRYLQRLDIDHDNFRAPESVDPVVVDDELEFFGIDLHHMIEAYDEIIAAKNPVLPPTLKECINKTVGIYSKSLR